MDRGRASASREQQSTGEHEVEQWEYDSLSDTETDSVFSSSNSSEDDEGQADGASGFDALELDALSTDSSSDGESVECEITEQSSAPSAPVLEGDLSHLKIRGKVNKSREKVSSSTTDIRPPASKLAADELAHRAGSGLQMLATSTVELALGTEGASSRAQGNMSRAQSPDTAEAPMPAGEADDALPPLEEILPLADLPQTLGGLESEDDAPIWQRTRARKPLTDVTLEELEALLIDEKIDFDAEDDDAYEDFLKALQGDMGSETALLPEDDDDDNDADFILDLDDLLAFGEDELQPSPAASPLQTRLRSVGITTAGSDQTQWVPQSLADGADKTAQPVTKRLRRRSKKAMGRKEAACANESSDVPSAMDTAEARAEDKDAVQSPDEPGHAPSQLEMLAATRAEELKEHLKLRADYLEWKREEQQRRRAAYRRLKRKQDERLKAEADAVKPPRSSPQARKVARILRRREDAAEAQHPDHTSSGRHVSEESDFEDLAVTDGGERASRAEIEPRKADDQSLMALCIAASNAEEQSPPVVVRAHLRDSAAPSGAHVPLQNSIVQHEGRNLQPSAEFQARAQPIDSMARLQTPALQQPAQSHPTGAAVMQEQGVRTLVPGGRGITGQSVSARNGSVSATSSVLPSAVWTQQQKGILRRQIGQHLQLLCQATALSASRPPFDSDGKKIGLGLLTQFMSLGVQAMGMKELHQAPFLPEEITGPLDQSCPDAPPQPPVRCLLAVPLLPHIPAFTAAIEAMDGGPGERHAAASNALDELNPFMNKQLFPKRVVARPGWLSGEKQLLRLGLQRFGKRVELLQKYLLPTKTIDSIRDHIAVEEDRKRPSLESLPPLSEAELNVVRRALQQYKGSDRIWTLLSQTELPHRSAGELRQLYWFQGYGVNFRWQRINALPAGTRGSTQAAQQVTANRQPAPILPVQQKVAVQPPGPQRAVNISGPEAVAPALSRKRRAAELRAKLWGSLEDSP